MNLIFSFLFKGVRRSGSNSSLNSMAAFEGEMYVRICRDCWTNLESRFHYLETLHAPHPISHLYRVLMRSLQVEFERGETLLIHSVARAVM